MISTEVLMIFGMFVATFGVRYVLFAVDDKMALPVLVLEALKYVPVAVLTAIIVPATIWPSSNVVTRFGLNPYICGTLVSAAIAYKFKNLNLTIAIGFVAFYLARYLLGTGS